MPKKTKLTSVVIILISSFFAVVLSEVAYRTYLYISLSKQVTNWLSLPMIAANVAYFDEKMGYQYKPNLSVSVDKPFPVKYTSNNFGHITDREYTFRKNKGEYRIVVVGDSFCAGVTNTVRWPDLLHEIINKNPNSINNSQYVTVINICKDGIGTMQFGDIVKHDGMRFDPDLIIVNFISDDLRRNYYSRGEISSVGNTKNAIDVNKIVQNIVYDLPWFSLQSEILSVILQNPSPIKQSLQRLNKERYMSDDYLAYKLTMKSFREIESFGRSVIYLLAPEYAEMKSATPCDSDKLMAQIMGGIYPNKIYCMNKYLNFDRTKLDSYYNVPYDTHLSDKGLHEYAKVVSEILFNNFKSYQLN
jgi:hypothetical protein